MGTFKLGKMTLRSLVHKPATVRYPYEKRDFEKLFPQMRGHVVNDIDTCILCGMCQRVCPVGAITVDRKAGDWAINPYSCIQCASCTHECPKNCLSMGLWPTEPTTEISSITLHKDMPAKPAKAAGAAAKADGAAAVGAAAKPKRELTPEQQARVEAARKAAAAKKAAKADAEAEAGETAAEAAAPAATAEPSGETAPEAKTAVEGAAE